MNCRYPISDPYGFPRPFPPERCFPRPRPGPDYPRPFPRPYDW